MEMPREKQPHERIQTYDTFGRLKYLGREPLGDGDYRPKSERKMLIECACGEMMAWAACEVARRRRRWAAKGMTPQCRACEFKEYTKPKTRPLWQRNMDPTVLGKVRETWRSMCYDRVRQDREFRGNYGLQQLLNGMIEGSYRYCDPLQFHIDRRWTSVFEGNPDPFETFLHDMGSPPDHKPFLLRRDPYGPSCKANCYWGDAADRRNNRVDKPAELRKLGTRFVILRGPDGQRVGELMPYSIVQGSRYDPVPATNPTPDDSNTIRAMRMDV